MAMTGNFGMPLNYDDGWVGRYYVQKATMLGLSFMPTVAYKINDKWSVGAGFNAMYGIYKNQVAINNLNPLIGDGQLKMEDETWGWGANLGVLFEPDARTRFGLVWNSQVNLDFSAPLEFSNLGPVIQRALDSRGLLNSTLNVGIKVPQGVMLSGCAERATAWRCRAASDGSSGRSSDRFSSASTTWKIRRASRKASITRIRGTSPRERSTAIRNRG